MVFKNFFLKFTFIVSLLAGSSWILMASPESEKQNAAPESAAKATFAGGCFWCMEHPFDELKGVYSTTSGYIGGHKKDPTYREVTAGTTGHTEAVQVVYDPAQVDYATLLKVFWKNIDPTVKDRQFCDTGSQYRTGIFYHDEQQEMQAAQSKSDLVKSQRFKNVYTEVTEASTFYPAEDYHQDYYLRNPLRYKYYRYACGRDQRLEQLWGGQG